jgi:hypothetical protein
MKAPFETVCFRLSLAMKLWEFSAEPFEVSGQQLRETSLA